MKRSDQEAITELLLSDPEEALACVRELRSADGKDLDLLAFEAECVAETGDFRRALELWGRYVEQDPDYLTAYAERCRIFVELGELEAAAAEANLCDELFGGQAATAYSRAFLMEARGDYSAADKLFAAAGDLEDGYEAPPRLAKSAVKRALIDTLEGVGTVKVFPMPRTAGDEGMGRAFDLDPDSGVTVYQRNVERSLDADADPAEFAAVIGELWSSVQAD